MILGSVFFFFSWRRSWAFVALYLRMFVARANKVEGTMSWYLGTNEILASIKHGIA